MSITRKQLSPGYAVPFALNRYLAPSFLCTSVPKAGTHLVKKALTSFPGIRWSGIHLDTLRGITTWPVSEGDRGQSVIRLWDSYVDRDEVNQVLSSINRGSFATSHLPYAEGLETALGEQHMKTILVLRDPRDVAVSHAHYVSSRPQHHVFDYYRQLSPSERIMTSIQGTGTEAPRIPSIRKLFDAFLPWRSSPLNLTVSFESLVGPLGGGTREGQLGALTSMALHLELRTPVSVVNTVASDLFGGTATFRNGAVGGWKKDFTSEHERACKELVGDLLIDLGYERDLNW
jgi:hypothetical protein